MYCFDFWCLNCLLTSVLSRSSLGYQFIQNHLSVMIQLDQHWQWIDLRLPRQLCLFPGRSLSIDSTPSMPHRMKNHLVLNESSFTHHPKPHVVFLLFELSGIALVAWIDRFLDSIRSSIERFFCPRWDIPKCISPSRLSSHYLPLECRKRIRQ